MKKNLLLAVVMLFAGALSAQNEVAILSHNGTLTSYSGATALAQALSSAVSEDIITVSSGTFSINSIPAGVTVRGAGFEEDIEAGGILPTIVTFSGNSGPLTINQNANIEGIRFNDNVSIYGNVHLTKCYFEDYLYVTNASNATIINCFIQGTMNGSGLQNSTITNSIIGSYNSGSTGNQLRNCIVGDLYYGTLNTTTNGDQFTGCILITSSNASSTRSQTNCHNCIGLYRNNDGYTPFFQNAINYAEFQQMTEEQRLAALATCDTTHHNYNASSFGELFEALTSITAAPYTNYSLTPVFDTLANRLNIGVYKGMVPYTPFVNRPHYVRTYVSPRTTADGQLSIGIQVVTDED